MKNLIFYPSGFLVKKVLLLFFFGGMLGTSYAQEVCEINGPELICSNDELSGVYSIKENNVPPGGYVEWEVTPGGTFVPSGHNAITVTWPQGTGNYLVIADVYNAAGELVAECELEVSVGQPVSDVGISPPFITVCPEQPIDFMGISDCNDCTFGWTVSANWVEGVDYDFVSADEQSATIVFYTPNSTGAVQYVATNSSGCSTAANSQVFVGDVSEPSFEVIEGTENGGNIEVCNGQEIFFDNTTVGNFIYQWQIIEMATSQEWNYFTEELSFNFPSTGLYTVTLINYFAPQQICFNSTTQTINVQAGIPIPIICPSVVCEGQTATYEVEEDCTTYNWTVVQPDGTETTMTGNPISVTWSLEGGSFGTGYVIFHPDGCPSNFCAGPSVQDVPIFPSEFEMTGLEFICRSENFTTPYTLTSSHLPGATYDWAVDIISSYSGGFSGKTLSEIIDQSGNDHAYYIEFEDADETLFNGVVRISVEIAHPIAGCIGYVEKIVEVIQGEVAGPHEICHGDEAVCEFSPDPGRTINWSLSLGGNQIIAPTPGGAAFTIPATALTETGNYFVSAEVIGDLGGSCPQIGFLTVFEVPPAPEVEGQVLICPGTPYDYSIANCNGQYQVEWTINNGGVVSTQVGCSVDVVWAATGPYSISAVQQIISDGEIACTSPATDLEITTGTPSVEILPNENPCPSSIVEYEVSPAGWTSYNWIAPANGSLVSVNGTSTIRIQWFDVEAPTPYVVTVEVNNNECVPPITLDVVITPFELEINAGDICADDPVSITSNATSADSYQWFVNNELVSTNATLNYIFPTSDFYDIRLETVNPNGCMGIFKKAITIYASPNPVPVISRAIDFCSEDGTVVGTLSVTPNSPDFTYQWFLDGSEIDGANGPVLDIAQTGTYAVTIDYGLCENSAVIVIDCVEDECDCTIGSDFEVFQIDHLDYDGTCGSIGFSGTIVDLSNAAFANWVIEGPNAYSDVIAIQSVSDLTISGFQLPQVAGLYTLYLEACLPCSDSEGCCLISERARIVIPFIPEFDFTFTCAGENSYDLTLLDVSSYYVSAANVNVQWEVNSAIYNGPSVNVPGLMPGTTAQIDLQISAAEYPTYTCNLSETIDLPESVDGTFTFSGGLCADQAITFTPAMELEELLEWEWIFNDEITILSYSPEFSFEEAGTHQVTLNLTSVYGCTSQYTEMITVGDPLEGEIEASMENCGATATLSYDQTSGDPVVEYLWGPTGETSPTIEVMETGIYAVTVTNAEGCVAISSTSVDLDNPFLNGISGPSEICEGEVVAFFVAPSAVYDFEWDISPCPVFCPIPGNVISTAGWAPATYTITVKALQGGEECLSETTTLVVHDVPNFSVTQDVTQCEPFSVTLGTNFFEGENNGTIEWSSTSVAVPEGTTGTTFIASQNGSYRATYTDDSTGCSLIRSRLVTADIDFSLFPVGCYDYCADELAENPLVIQGISSPLSDYVWEINYGDGYGILDPPGAGTTAFIPDTIPSAEIDSLPAGETEAKIRLTVDNGICEEESGEICITVEECCETCPKILNLRCEEILPNGDVVFAIDGDLACLPEGYEFCGTSPVILNGGTLEVDEGSVVIYEPPMFDPLYWFAGTLVVTNFDYFVANGGLEAEIDICNGQGTCKAQFFIEYENGGGAANIDVTCVADPSECATDVYEINAEIPIPLGWTYCGQAPVVVDGGYLEFSNISSTCDQISFSGQLFVTDPDFYQSNQGLELGVNICQDGEVQTVTAQIPYESCDHIWPFPYRVMIDCVENQNFVELCLFTPYFTACNPCEEQPLELLVLASNPPIILYEGLLGEGEGDYGCFEFVLPDSGDDLNCINFYVFNDCYGSAWTECQGNGCDGGLRLSSFENETVSGQQDLAISFDLVPNPATNQVSVQLSTDAADSDSVGEIVLQDVFGRTYAQETVRLQDVRNIQLELANLPAGIYWVVLRNETGLLQAKKLVKQ